MLPAQWIPRLLLAIFLVSGATSLVYEVIWARQVQLLFGTSQVAISTVLAGFMAGLALGGFAGARWTHRARRPLLVYAGLEAFIGLYALAFPSFLQLGTGLYLAFWRSVEPGPTAFGAFQLVLAGVLLLPPTVCMGATLPLLVGFLRATSSQAGLRIGHLYGANTIGAVIGTGLAGFVLLPRIGLAATTRWAVVANFCLGLAALAFSIASETVGHKPRIASPSASAVAEAAPRSLLLIAGLAGFCSLLYEVAWFRLLTLAFGGSTYAFSIMLVAFLLGIGFGGWVGGAAADRSCRHGGHRRVLLTLATLQAGVALLSWAAMYLYAELPVAVVQLYDLMRNAPRWVWGAELLIALAIMLPAALLMGATFPYLVRAATERAFLEGRPVGQLYGSNTLGAIAGAAGGGLVLLPALTIRGAVLAAASVNLVTGLIAGAIAGALRGRRLVVATLATVCAVVLVHWRKPPWNALLMNSGPYLYVSHLEDRTRQGFHDFAVRPFTLLFYEEGLSSAVTVARSEGGNLWLANNGKVDASLGDHRTQVLLGHLPVLFHPDPKHVLVIGFASGWTTGSAALHSAPSRIDVAEIEPAVVRASHFFEEYNHRPLEDPRVRLYLNDARNHLLLTKDGAYDLVICEPSNPWLSGVSNLFTREFFALGKRKLAAGGVWAQWVQTYGLHFEDVRSLLATFADAYASVLVFRVSGGDLVLLGSERPLTLDISTIRDVLTRSNAVADELKGVDVSRAEDVLGLYLFGRDTMVQLAGDVERNTDDNMRVEYSGPLSLHSPREAESIPILQDAAVAMVDAVSTKAGIIALARAYARRDPSGRRALFTAEEARARFPDDAFVIALYGEIQRTVAQRAQE